MEDKLLNSLPWLPQLKRQVEAALRELDEARGDCAPAMECELEQINSQITGWSQSLAKPDLAPAIRDALENEWGAADSRKREIEALLSAQNHHRDQARRLIDPQEIIDRLQRLADVLAAGNPTLGNVELSHYIDGITCFPDGKVVLRTCKLGILTEGIELLSKPQANGSTGVPGRANSPADSWRGTPRRRGRLRTDFGQSGPKDMRAMADFAADTRRFAGLADDWFWEDEFEIPVPAPSWAQENAVAVFHRRQETKFPFSKLAQEFGVTRPTIGAAIREYLKTHPDVNDEVYLRGGKRKPRINVALFADEARALWEADWSKEKLAEKFGCSPPTIDKALVVAYEKDGLSVPTRSKLQHAKVTRARELLDADHGLEEIASLMQISDVTARHYLKLSFQAEGKTMPDLRSRRQAG